MLLFMDSSQRSSPSRPNSREAVPMRADTFSWNLQAPTILDSIAGSAGLPSLFIGTDYRIHWISPEARHLLGFESMPDEPTCRDLLEGKLCQNQCTASAPKNPDMKSGDAVFQTCCFTPIRPPFVIQTQTVSDKDGHLLGLLKSVRVGEAKTGDNSLSSMAPTSTWVEELRPVIPKIARTNIPILLVGETGTGKECFARLIHEESDRRKGPFVVLDLSLVPETLIEDALFGHIRGAFTGAMQDQLGKLYQSNGGTLFLDEIQNISHAVQMKLLRFLENSTFEPIGSRHTQKVDVRIIAATNESPEDLLREHRLRPDLFYRLNGLSLEIPPLRERPKDIPVLLEHFRSEWSRRTGLPAPTLASELIDVMASYDFPGNIRELRHMVETLLSLSEPLDNLTLDRVPPSIRKLLLRQEPNMALSDSPGRPLHEQTLQEFERQRIKKALFQARGRISEASKSLGISRVTLWRKMKRLDLSS